MEGGEEKGRKKELRFIVYTYCLCMENIINIYCQYITRHIKIK